MATALVILGSVALVALLVGAGWVTERRRNPSESGPSLREHAAADAGRVGAMAATGPHDAVGVGAPTHLDDVTRSSSRA